MRIRDRQKSTLVTAEFICEDCGDHVYAFGEHDGVPVCGTCRFIRQHPDMPEETKAALRGDDHR
jgi:hypothetical protein